MLSWEEALCVKAMLMHTLPKQTGTLSGITLLCWALFCILLFAVCFAEPSWTVVSWLLSCAGCALLEDASS